MLKNMMMTMMIVIIKFHCAFSLSVERLHVEVVNDVV